MPNPSADAPPRPALVWFTRDLRLHDQPALTEAIATGRPVIACYVLDDRAEARIGGASRWWLHHSLQSLSADLARLRVPLVLRRGDMASTIAALVAETGAVSVHAGHMIEPAGRAALAAIGRAGIPINLHWTSLLFDPDAIRTQSGTPYGVYTPFSRACLSRQPLPPPLPRPGAARLPVTDPPPTEDLDEWALPPTRPDWAGGLRATWQVGEAAAVARVRQFLADAVAAYAEQRNLPGRPGVSRLSPHLHFGEISVRAIWQALDGSADADSAGARSFRNELLWREFSAHLLWHHPHLPDAPLRQSFDAMQWRHDPAGLAAWQRGQTGIPIVDAGMRELWQTGWMHNRVRMITASFLIKHLLIDWREGEAWFWDTLVDADLASNAASWQWVAGCGADAAPFFRIFNPELQGRKFDPDGAYVRRFVPELANLPAEFLHAPWTAPALVLRAAGIVPNRTYPEPIIDLAAGRQRALDAFRLVTDKIADDPRDR